MGQPDDRRWMRAALAIAAQASGTTGPNPAVGCMIVKDGRVVSSGCTAPGGRPHAERVALDRAGAAAAGATAYVTLEPCAHHGQTPPCADALIAAGVARVVIGTGDPDPRVNGAGIARLRDAGLDVLVGCEEMEARRHHRGFITRTTRGRPAVTLKLAMSADGRIATSSGASQWITDAAARAAGHALRARHDAVMVGIGTALADDPQLTVRLPGLEGRQAVRIVADSRLRLSLTSKLVRDVATQPLWIACRADAAADRMAAFREAGAKVMALAGPAGGAEGLEPQALLAALGAEGLSDVLVEGGARLAASLMRGGLVDRLVIFRAPLILGGDGLAALAGFGLQELSEAPRYELVSTQRCGDGTMDLLERAV